MQLKVLSAGAAQSVVTALAKHAGFEIDATFDAVGTIKDQLAGGAPCDLVVLSRKVIAELATAGHVVPESVADLGVVHTGIAVREGDARPDISSAAALRASLVAAQGIYFPDPQRATAGIHFAHVLQELSIKRGVAAHLRPFPNGATAMRELAHAKGERLIGCTQITEIKNTPGLVLVGRLPREFELATTYTLAVCSRAAAPDEARRFAVVLAGDVSRKARIAAGFEV